MKSFENKLDELNYDYYTNQLLNSKGYFALNSLHKKFIGWENKSAAEAIKKGSLILDNINQFTARLDWESYWNALYIRKREDEEKTFAEHASEISVFGNKILFYSILMEIFLSIEKYKKDGVIKIVNDVVIKLDKFVERIKQHSPATLNEKDIKLCANLHQLIENNFSTYDRDKFFSYIHRNVEGVANEMSKILPIVQNSLELFEQSSNTVLYQHMIYYDIVDSTATKKKVTRKDVDFYRNKISKTKNSINGFINKIEKEAATNDEEIYCWNGDKTSTNDAKHVFFSSSKKGFNLRRVSDFLDRLYAHADEDIYFRSIVTPCDAYHSHVFRRFKSIEVEGEQFWEHYSRISKQFKDLETKYADYGNLLLIVDDTFSNNLNDSIKIKVNKLWEGELTTDIAGLKISNKCVLWNVFGSKK